MARFRYSIFLLGIIIIILMVACSSSPTVNQNNGPILLQEVTIAPSGVAPTRALTNTPSSTPPVLEAPQQAVTVESGFVLVTPTLPPSKTPTITPSITATSSVTPIVIPSLLPTTAVPQSGFATSVIVPLTNIPPTPFLPPNNNLNPPPIGSFTTPTPNTPVPCQFGWFFINPQPPVCPLSPQTLSPAAYQQFENGFMIWVGSQDAIYVMFNDVLNPRWQVFRDNYEEGMPADDPLYNNPPNPNTYQPRRGFGLLWRNNEIIRSRLGWATTPDEIPYNAQNQTGADSTLFISDPQNGVFMLLAQGIEWERFINVGVVIP